MMGMAGLAPRLRGRKTETGVLREALDRVAGGGPAMISDLDRRFCHAGSMISGCVTPMHHPMSMGSSAAPAGGG
jgi:hypothetical protein